MEQYIVMPQDHSKRNIWAVCVLVVVFLVITLLYFYSKNNTSHTPPKLEGSADTGELVSGFPGGLIVARGARITNSYTYATSSETSSGKLLTANYETNLSLDALYQLYVNYAEEKGFQILKSTNNPTSRTFFIKAFGTTSISMFDLGDKRQVMISVNK
jgi:hypothetical protein